MSEPKYWTDLKANDDMSIVILIGYVFFTREIFSSNNILALSEKKSVKK